MINFKKFINGCIARKYKGMTNFNKNFIKTYYKERLKKEKNIKFCLNLKILNKDKTCLDLKKILIAKTRKLKYKKVIAYYKKFEVNLSLKRHYDKNFKKKTNSETNINSYIFLGLLINKLKILNKYQKINCILKIMDKLYFSGSSTIILVRNDFFKLKNLEMKLLKDIL